MELRCIGTGGGRFCMTTQARETGGFVLSHDGFLLAVDPAPGALVRGLEQGIDFSRLDAIFISHSHLDHQGDADVLIEAMTKGCTEEKGMLIGNETVLQGSDRFDPGVSSYHRQAPERVVTARPDEAVDLGELSMTFRATRHKGIPTTGFVLDYGERRLGYIPDTERFDGLVERFEGCDTLIVNVLRPHDRSWEGHLNLEEAVELVGAIEPERAFFQHFGMNFVQSFHDEVEWLEEQHGEKDITLASDGATYSIDGKEGLERFVE
jgi:phosphoribosyl 1,2-cyclic phosphodiesterase